MAGRGRVNAPGGADKTCAGVSDATISWGEKRLLYWSLHFYDDSSSLFVGRQGSTPLTIPQKDGVIKLLNEEVDFPLFPSNPVSTSPLQFRNAQSHHFSTREKARFLFVGLKQCFTPARNLIAGPFAGEFGYELMQWQGYVRARRPLYRESHVITYPGREYLYEGCTMHSHDIPLQKAGYA